MEMSTIIKQLLMLFVILVIGYIGNRCKVLDKNANKVLSKCIINITLSALIISSVMNIENKVSFGELGMLLFFASLVYVFMTLISLVIPRIIGVPQEDRGVYSMMAIFGNVAFMGFPILKALYGSEIIFYASLFNIPFNLLLYSLGMVFLSPRGTVKINKNLFLNPPLISSVVALIIYLLPVNFPVFFVNGLSMLGDMTIPGAMLVIGSSLAEVSIKEIFNDFRIYLISLVKLVVFPLMVWAVLKPFVTDPLLLAVGVVTTAMPMATNITMLSITFGGNEALASKGIFISTLMSLITIPLVLLIL